MRLLKLEITNFRCFAQAEMNLNASGVIGIRGLNGAGKSSIFDAVFFALYGPGAGRRLPVRRDDAPDSEPTSVAISFTYDEGLVEVARDEDRATIAIDGTRQADTKAATTAEVTRLLGLDRHQFVATFYARQKEVESFSNTSERLRNVKKLLGLTRLQKAAEIGRADLNAQALVVTTLAQGTPDVGEARAFVAEQLGQVEELAPAITAATEQRNALAEHQQAAWQTLSRAEADTERLQVARGDAQLGQEWAKSARTEASRVAQALDESRQAKERVVELAPTAARVPELQAAVGQFDLRKQANEHHLATRAARADAQRRLAEKQDELAGLAAPERPSDKIAGDLAGAQQELSQLTEQLLARQRTVAEVRAQAAAAARAQEAAARAEALRAELITMPELERASVEAQATLLEVQSRRARVENELIEEAQHAAEVRRDGPDAKCLRCRRAYGDQFATILAEFEATIEQLTAERDALDERLAEVRAKDVATTAHLTDLRRKEGELASLPLAEQPLADVQGLAAEVDRLTTEIGVLETGRGELIERSKALRDELQEASALETTRDRAAESVAQTEAEVELLGRQLAERVPERYDPDAHQQARVALGEAQAADDACRRLGAIADGFELCERRHAAAQGALSEAEDEVGERAAVVEALSAEAEPLDQARERVQALADELHDAQAALAELSQTQVRLQKDLEAAEATLRAALREQRRLRAAQLEMQVVQAAAEGLAEYALEAQRRAIPRLETETAELLARLSGGAYADVRLDDRAALTLLDAGEHRPLERFSGGEQDLAYLCLRLALSRTFAATRGTDPGMIILDEVFGSQDLERRGILLDHLRRLEDEFEQVFVISHFDDVTAACDVQFEVRKTAGVSEILPV